MDKIAQMKIKTFSIKFGSLRKSITFAARFAYKF
jgi:hypothetical protein